MNYIGSKLSLLKFLENSINKVVDKSFPALIRLKIFWYEIKSNTFVLFFEPFLVKQWWQLFKLRKKIRARRDQMKKRVKIKTHLEKLME